LDSNKSRVIKFLVTIETKYHDMTHTDILNDLMDRLTESYKDSDIFDCVTGIKVIDYGKYQHSIKDPSDVDK